jgi:hypothetical protein
VCLSQESHAGNRAPVAKIKNRCKLSCVSQRSAKSAHSRTRPCSDGLWDVLTYEEAVELIAEVGSPSRVCTTGSSGPLDVLLHRNLMFVNTCACERLQCAPLSSCVCRFDAGGAHPAQLRILARLGRQHHGDCRPLQYEWDNIPARALPMV